MKIFISSTAYDLSDFRALIVDLLQERGHEVIYHESPTFPAKLNLHSHDQCTLAVEECDIVICVIDRRYGGKYKGVFPNKFPKQTVEILGSTKNGNKKKYNVEIETKDLSITWCELITAYDHQIPVITFSRQRTLDEKETKRRNQFLKSFQPSYVEKNELFDLIDWITKRPNNNWIVSYINIVDFRAKLIKWIDELEQTIHPAPTLTSSDLTNGGNQPVSDDNSTTSNLMLSENLTFVSQSKICIIVEGEIDRTFINYLIKKLRLNNYFVVIPSYGKYRTLNNFDSTIAEYASIFDEVIILMDADTKNENEISTMYNSMCDLIQKSGKGNIKFQFAIPEIESWIAAGLNPDIFKEFNGNIDKDLFNKLFFTSTLNNITTSLKKNYDLNIAMSICGDLHSFVELLLSVGKKKNLK